MQLFTAPQLRARTQTQAGAQSLTAACAVALRPSHLHGRQVALVQKAETQFSVILVTFPEVGDVNN